MKRLASLFLAACLSLSAALPASALELEDAKTLLQTYYIDELPEDLDQYTTLEELFDALNDPYTSYLSAEEYTKLLTKVNGSSIEGIGVTLHTVFNKGYLVQAVLPGSPAQGAGLQPGDVIVSVDDVVLTADMDPTAYIRGQSGTQITVGVRRPNVSQLLTFTMLRAKVTIPIVNYKMVGDALVIQCDSFGQSTVDSVADALETFQQDASVCIMDLRANPGGTSTAAAGSAGLFLGAQVMSYFRAANGLYNNVYTTKSCPDLTDKPVISLLSGYSASGSELFSAAIRDHNGGIAVGQRSFGKGIAQQLFDEKVFPDLFDGDCVKITVYRFFSPAGATNDTIGVLPSLVVPVEHTSSVALLLSSPKPECADHHLRLKLAGHTFYIDLEQALSPDYQAAFVQLLQAIPPSAQLQLGLGGPWLNITPSDAAEKLGLTMIPRTFSDAAGTPYETEIHTLSCYDLVSGYGDGTFRPQQMITRAEFCAMVSSALNLDTLSAESPFSDTHEDAWYSGAVSAMWAKGFISGYEDGTFRPDNTITYEEMVCVLNQVSEWASMNGYAYNRIALEQEDAAFYGSFSPWAQLPARNLDLLGALLPDTAPSAPGTREQAAAALCRMMDGCHLLWH